MTLSDLDHELVGLRAAVEHIGANLVAVEQDPVVALLDVTDLRGRSAERWGAARVVLADLFGSFTALGSVVERAVVLRGTGRWLAAARARELSEVVHGRSVVVTGPTVALADRGLLGSSRTATRWTPAALVEQMSASFDEVRAVIATAARTWDVGVARTRAVRARVAELDDVGAATASTRSRLETELDALATDALADPLSFDWARLDQVEADVAVVERELDLATELRDDLATTLDVARDRLGEVTATLGTAAAAIAATEARIVVPAGLGTVGSADDLATELGRIEARATTGAWSEAAAALVAWRTSADERCTEATTIAAEHEALLLVRAELRGRLDAYRAKADRQGRLEDPVTTTLHRQAHDVLHLAPTDLVEAADLVRRYQEALADPRPVRCGGAT